jgi:hypothetical protein
MMQHGQGFEVAVTAEVPVALVQLVAGREGWGWRVPRCPYCGAKHMHGGGAPEDNPRQMLTHRRAQCHQGNGYVLVEAAGTAARAPVQ